LENGSKSLDAAVRGEEEFLVEIRVAEHREFGEQVLDGSQGRIEKVSVLGTPFALQDGVQWICQLRKHRYPSSIELAQTKELSNIGETLELGVFDLLNVMLVGLNAFSRDLESKEIEPFDAEEALCNIQCHGVMLDAVEDQSNTAKMLIECGATNYGDVVYVVCGDLEFQVAEHDVHQMTEVGASVPPPVWDALPSEKAE
jgi:hypothetical protein